MTLYVNRSCLLVV